MQEVSSLVFTGERIVPQADNCEPNFASRMFQEHIVRYLFAAQLVEGKSVLDIGCGVGYGSQRLGQLGARSVYAFDLSEDSVQHARIHYSHPSVQFEVGDAENFSFDQKFDIVTCFELIEHVNHPRKVLANIKRALKPDGILVMSTPRALDELRTHFHMHEYNLGEYRELIDKYFKKVEIYSENNHFSSLVTLEQPTNIERIECLQDQFDPSQADVFIAVATQKETTPLPPMTAALSIDNDAYVTMLERDVAILHKAEDDLREKLEYWNREHAGIVAFKDAEIDRLEAEYKKVQTEGHAFKDAEISRLTDEYNALFLRVQNLSRKLWEAETIGGEVEPLRAALTEARLRIVGSEEQKYLAVAEKDGEIARFRLELQDRLVRAEQLSAELDVASETHDRLVENLASMERANESKDAEILKLSGDYKALLRSSEELLARLRETEMNYSNLDTEHQALRATVDALAVRVADADTRRMEAYEFARSSSDLAQGLRRELDALKRNLNEALDSPQDMQHPLYDHRHRDIVDAMDRLFVGTDATHYIASDPLVTRVSRLSLEMADMRARVAAAESEVAIQRERAERAEAFAEDWHAQILKLRNSGSWKYTKIFRGIAKRFRRPG